MRVVSVGGDHDSNPRFLCPNAGISWTAVSITFLLFNLSFIFFVISKHLIWRTEVWQTVMTECTDGRMTLVWTIVSWPCRWHKPNSSGGST